MPSLQQLYLYNNQLSSLHKDTFKGLSSLSDLRLYNNDLSSLPTDIFKDLSNLRSLLLNAIRDSRILNRRISTGLGLDNLRTLFTGLGRPNPQELALWRAVLPSLVTLTLQIESAARFCWGASNPVQGRTQKVVDAIVSSVSGVTHCRDITSAHLSALTELDISGVNLITLRAGDFAGMTALQTLHLYDNDLTSLPAGVFNGLSNLQTLNVYDNKLTSLPANAFNGLSNLQTLRLDQNPDLTVPAPSYFDGQSLTSLTELRLGLGVPNAQELAPYRAVISTLTTLRLNVEDAATTCGTGPLQGRTKKVADAIATAASKACSAVTANDLAAITSLDISNTGLTMLRADDFDGLSGLQTLNMSSDIYDGDTSNDNRLASLPADIFDGLSNLRTLNLYENRLESLPADVFDGLSNLQALRLYGNQLSSLHADVFDGLSNLQKLLLNHNRLSSLSADVFDGLSNLQWLYLYNNQLSSLHKDTFKGLSSLTRLHLYSNGLSSLPVEVFDGLSNLQELYLYSNRLSSLHKDTFKGLSSLNHLSLYSNQLTFVPEGIFKDLSNLDALLLYDNPDLIELEPSFFDNQGLTSLTTLRTGLGDPNDQELASYKRVIPTLTTLSLNIQSAALCRTDPSDPDTAGPLHGRTKEVVDLIIDLYFPGSHCSDITTADLAVVDRLHLDGRNLALLRAGDFTGLTGLQQLYLHENDLASLPTGVFDGLPSLQRLYLNHNLLTSLDKDTFKGTPNLQRLYLNHNRLTSIHRDAFKGLPRLTQLHLHTNQLVSIDRYTFNGLSSLQELHIRNNRLTSLHRDTFDGLSNLDELFLNINRLTFLPDGIFNDLSNLDTLLLEGNTELVNLEPDFFRGEGLGSLRTLRMGEIRASAAHLASYQAADMPSLATLYLHVEPLASCGSSPVNGRTQKVVDAVMDAVADVTACEDIQAEHLAAITSLDLSGQGILNLNADDFAGMSGLTILNLNGNLLSSLPDGIFDGLSVTVTTEDETVRRASNGMSGLTIPNPRSNLLASLPLPVTTRSETVAGIFNDESGLTALDSNRSHLASLPAPAIANDETVAGLTALDVNDNHLTSSARPATRAKDETVRSIFKGLSSLMSLGVNGDARASQPVPAPATSEDETVQLNLNVQPGVTMLDLSGNRLTSLEAGVFAGLTDLQELNLSNNRLTSLVANLFQGLSSLRVLRIDSNPGLTDPEPSYFRGQGLTSLTTLYLGSFMATPQEFASYRAVLPALQELRFSMRATPTPIPGSRFYIRIRRIEPDVESVALNAGAKIRLKLKVFGRQNIQDDSLADDWNDDRVSFIWTSSDDSAEDGFEESTSYANRRNQEADDRTVLYTAPDAPGEYTVTAKLDSDQCVGDKEECSATVKIIVRKIIAIPPSPTPIPCQISGEIPSVVTDSLGNQYSVFTPAQGGTFSSGDRTADITAPINAIQGCEYIGIRLETNGMASNVNDDTHRYTLAGQIYSLSAIDSRGTEIFDYQFDVPARVCVPMPPSLRGGITDISLIKLNHAPDSDIADSLTVLSSKIVIMPNGDPRVCGVLGNLPAEIAAGNRGAPTPVPPPAPSPTPEAPQTGGGTVPYSWIMLFAILGVGVMMLGSAVLIRGNSSNSTKNRN